LIGSQFSAIPEEASQSGVPARDAYKVNLGRKYQEFYETVKGRLELFREVLSKNREKNAEKKAKL